MRANTIAYALTTFAGVALLGSLLWSNALFDGLSFLLVFVSLFLFVASVVGSFVPFLFRHRKLSLQLLLINILVCLLVVPTIRLGSFLNERFFLWHLAEFQEATNLLIENARATQKEGVSYTGAQLPDRYSNLHVAKSVLLHFTKEGVTVSYITRDSSALGHRGYLYCSNDDPIALKRDFPRLGYKRLASHWFFFAD